jgi:hypothetical protein
MPRNKTYYLNSLHVNSNRGTVALYSQHKNAPCSIGNEQVCEYIEDMAKELSDLASRIDQGVLAHFLTLVNEEARSAKNRERLLSSAA